MEWAKALGPTALAVAVAFASWQDDRDKLWDVLKDVMSNPSDGLVPAKRKLIDINLAQAAQATKDILTDLIAKTIAEVVKP